MFSFCKPVSSKKRFTPFRTVNSEYSFTLFDKASSIIAEDWDRISHSQGMFYERGFLRIIEDSGHARLMPRYVIVYHNRKPCGIIYFQVVDFKAGMFGSMLRNEVEEIKSRRRNLFERYIESNREEVLMRLFTCGNNLISGEYGFLFDKRTSKEKSQELVIHITDVIAREERLRGTISAILLKDFYEPLKPKKLMDVQGYFEFMVEPNMIVQFPDGVGSLEEYVALFSKKYRNRARSVLRGRESLQVRELKPEEIRSHEKEIYGLYGAIFEQARFKLLKLPADYFSRMKEAFPGNFNVKGFFLNGRMVAFCSSFRLPNDTLEAHYVGFDYELNVEYSLYQNLLYELLKEAIATGCKRLNLGRTAAEIKSTIGAVPSDLLCYIRPQNAVSRLIQKPFISFLQPGAWIQRNPFREEPAAAAP
jgi:hypothetical protein